jgi:hypothetical protein
VTLRATKLYEQPKNEDWKPIPVELPARYWITVLALVDDYVQKTVAPQLRDLQSRGAKVDDIPEVTRTTIMGPLFARGAMVKALHQAGIMTPEANARVGIDALMDLAKKYQK